MIFLRRGILTAKGVIKMGFKGWATTLGVGAAVGAVAIMMMPRNNPTRKLAAKAADKVETVAWKVSDELSNKFDL